MRPALRLVLPALAAAALLADADAAAAQTPAARTPAVANARVQDLSWIVGQWIGRPSGVELIEEWWDTVSTPGSLHGLFRHVGPGERRAIEHVYVERGRTGLQLRVARVLYAGGRFPIAAEGRAYPLSVLAGDSAVFARGRERVTLRRRPGGRMEVTVRRLVARRLRTDTYAYQRPG